VGTDATVKTMTKQREIIVQLDGSQRTFVGDNYEVRESALGLYEVWDTEKNRAIWSEGVHNGIREVVSINIP
jgi:hypothetical protein